MRFSTRLVTFKVPKIACIVAATLMAPTASAQAASTAAKPAPAKAPPAYPAPSSPSSASTATTPPKTAGTTTAPTPTAGSTAVAAPTTAQAPNTVTGQSNGAVTVGGSVSGTATATAPSTTTPAPAAAAPLTQIVTKTEPKADNEPADPLWTGTARFADRYYEIGIEAGRGGLLFAKGAQTPGLTGIRVLEHHGYVSKAAVTLAVALGQRDSQYVGSSYGNGYRIDYYRPLTMGERQAQAQQLADAINGEYTTEFTYYSSNMFGLGGTGAGFEMSMGGDISLGMMGRLPAILTLAGYGAYMTAPAVWDDKTRKNAPSELSFTAVGMAARVHIPIHPVADAFVEWDANLASLFDSGAKKREEEGKLYGSPLKVGGYFHLTDRGYVKAQAVLGGFGFSDGKLGYQAELGVRF